MGLAVLPERLKAELFELADALVKGGDIRGSESLAKHADWADELMTRYQFTEENAMEILKNEVGKVFAEVLECAGVYKCNESGRNAFMRFIEYVDR